MAGADPIAEARARFAAAAAALATVPDDAVAEFVPPSRRLGLRRAARLRPVGRAWRLGVLLLSADGTVRATGSVTRAVPPGHPGHMAASTEQRRQVRDAAFRGPFPEGATVWFDSPVIDLAALDGAAGPLFLRDGRVLVRWSVSADDDAARELGPYLDERVALITHPPQGAT